MILQILAHARQVGHHGNPEGLQPLPLPYAGKFQQDGRAHGPRRQNDLRAGRGGEAHALAAEFHPGGATALEKDALGLDAGFEA